MDTVLAQMPIIDIDTHLTEPPSLWLDRAPARLEDRAPRVIQTEEGRDQWVVPHTIERLGADNIGFETDYPHPTCLYPGVREQVQTCLGGLDASVQRKILYENAARVYGIELP